ncbi:MAG TPA: MFS transporter [Propionibacteriaceae bacterium]|jgi:MFS family permease|nr:MFS transporter [Propionibacteriaceae bacterium]
MGSVKEDLRQRSTRAVATGGRFVGSQVRRGAGAVHRYTISGGAGESGLARLTHVQFLAAAGDAAIAVSLAGTLFFTLPTDQARPQVAQFLLLTMAPFAIVAPLIGPFLDRFRHGRRWAIGTTLAVRAFLCWVLADVLDSSFWLFPAALGCLVASKAFLVTQASAVPRLLPENFTLVNANSRISMAKVVGAAVGGGIAAGIAQLGPAWSLRFGFAVFIAATVLAILLSPKVDSTAGEQDFGGVLLLPGPTAEPGRGRSQRRFRSLMPSVRHGLKCVMGARLMTGFLTLFLAFLLREHPISNLNSTLLLGVVVAVAGVGNSLGTIAGNLLKNQPPERIGLVVLAVDAATAVLTAAFYSIGTVIALAFVAGLCAQLAKLSYDAVVQRDVPEVVRTSVFARSETAFQVCWVLGGTLGIVLPLVPPLGFGLVAGLLCGLLVWTIVADRRAARSAAATATG